MEDLSNMKAKYISIVSNVDKKQELEKKCTKFYENITTIKDSIKEYNETNNINLIRDTITLYMEQLQPLLKEINDIKYKYKNCSDRS